MTLLYHREEVICDEPLLTVDRQMGLNIVHPEGKACKLQYKSLMYSQLVFLARKDNFH